jgi:hypothetical protein
MTTQLAVFMKNVPGTLHEILRSLKEAAINIEGIMVNDAADHAVVRLVVDAPSKAIHLLGDRGMLVVESEIICHEMTDRTGEIMVLAGELAGAGINISYIYGSTPEGGGRPRIFLHSSDNPRVLEVLAGRGTPAGKRSPGADGPRDREQRK